MKTAKLFHSVVILGMALATESACSSDSSTSSSGSSGTSASSGSTGSSSSSSSSTSSSGSPGTSDGGKLADAGGDAFAGWFCCG